MKAQRSSGSLAVEKARSQYQGGQYEAAISTLAEATVDEEDYPELAYILGLSYARLSRYDEALLYLEQVVTPGGKDFKASQCRLALAYVYSITDRMKLAEYELMQLVDTSFQTARVCAALGHASWMQGRLDDGLRWYAKALEVDPNNLTALNGYGYLLACAGKDMDKAMACCRKALEGDPANPAYADSLGWVYYKLGRLTEAGKHLRSVASVLADNAEFKSHIAAYEKAVKF